MLLRVVVLQWCLLVMSSLIYCQGMGIGTTSPDQSAVLEVESTTQGALLPRMTTSQRRAIDSPETGLIVFDLTKHTLYMFDGNTWRPLIFGTSDILIPPYQVGAQDNNGRKDYGFSVSVHGDVAIIGAPADTIGTHPGQGSAYVIRRINGAWVEEQKLVATDGDANDRFGLSVSVSGDYIAIGAPGHNSGGNQNQGAVYLYHWNGSQWVLHTKIVAVDGAEADSFGTAVSLSGDRIAIGAPYKNSGTLQDRGAVYMYVRSGNVWGQEALIRPFGTTEYDYVGLSLDLDSVTVIIGVPYDDHSGFMDAGSAYIFELENGLYLQRAFLYEGSPHVSDAFGWSVSIANGDAVVGMPLYDNAQYLNCGKVNVYHRQGTNSWPLRHQIFSPDVKAEGRFGMSVDLSQGIAVVGAIYEDVGLQTGCGKAWLFDIASAYWKVVRKIEDQLAHSAQFCGFATAIDHTTVLVGSYGKHSRRGEVVFVDVE